MPEMQPSVAAPRVDSVLGVEITATPEDFDYALGCECANPALQIDVWGEEARANAIDGR